MRQTGRLARFKPYKADPDRVKALEPEHPAVREGRTLFPSTVVGTFESAKFLVSGKNSPKTGDRVEKGPWAGMPIFTLTLEERATCPRSCVQFLGCYGNAMQWARRNDVSDPDFIPALKAEVITLIRQVCSKQRNRPAYVPPKGIVVRLHILGDFYSVAYVEMWAKLLAFLPELHVFGYTARQAGEPDGIGVAIAGLNAMYPDRWVIRTSRLEPGPGCAIVVTRRPTDKNIILCPAQEDGTENCATCGLCWLPAAHRKTIAFMLHGMVPGGRGPA